MVNFVGLFVVSLFLLVERVRPSDFIKWMISRFIRSRMSIVVNAKIGGFLQEKILHLAGLIADKDGFLHHVVNQLGGGFTNCDIICTRFSRISAAYEEQSFVKKIVCLSLGLS